MNEHRHRRHWLRWALLAVLVLPLGAAVAVWSLWRPASEAEAARLIERIGLQPGMTVGEIGAGSGTMAVFVARYVGPEGRLYANELSDARLDDLREAAAREHLPQLIVVPGAVDRTNLPDACCDAVFMRHVYHHFDEAALDSMLASLYAVVRPGGTLAIIDFPPSRLIGFISGEASRAEDDPRGHGISIDLLVEEVTGAGFVHRETVERWGGQSYLAVFLRP